MAREEFPTTDKKPTYKDNSAWDFARTYTVEYEVEETTEEATDEQSTETTENNGQTDSHNGGEATVPENTDNSGGEQQQETPAGN